MTDAGRSDSQNAGGAMPLLFSYHGRIGRATYWLGLAAVLAVAIVALVLSGQAMSTTGGDSVVLIGLPLLALAIWIHSAVAIKRLRDAGLAAWTYLLFVAVPLIAIAASIEFAESAWFLILAALIAVLAIPGLLKSKAL